MFEQEQIEAYAPQLREAFKDVVGVNATQYYRQDDLDLASSADQCPWMAPDEVRRYLPYIDETQVQLVNDTTDFNELLSKFIEEANIGLVLMGQNISRRKRPALIVLTTEYVYYAIDPSHARGIQFLNVCLKEEGVTVWTTNPLHEANCLQEQFNISLLNSQARDCLGVHFHLMRILGDVEECQYRDIYPQRATSQARRPFSHVRLESYERLIHIWLEIDDQGLRNPDSSQLGHLSQRPLNLTAINLIKKRCSLVVKLAQSLMFFVNLEHTIINKNVLNSLAQFKENAQPFKIARKRICRDEEEKRPALNHFNHIDGDIGDE